MNSPVFQWRHRVTYSECTIGNHVYYARYLDILEAARGELFRHLGRTFTQWQEADTIFPVIETHLIYKRAARYDDLLAIEIQASKRGLARMAFDYRVLDPGCQLLVEGSTVHACTTVNGAPKRLPEELVASLSDPARWA